MENEVKERNFKWVKYLAFVPVLILLICFAVKCSQTPKFKAIYENTEYTSARETPFYDLESDIFTHNLTKMGYDYLKQDTESFVLSVSKEKVADHNKNFSTFAFDLVFYFRTDYFETNSGSLRLVASYQDKEISRQLISTGEKQQFVFKDMRFEENSEIIVSLDNIMSSITSQTYDFIFSDVELYLYGV